MRRLLIALVLLLSSTAFTQDSTPKVEFNLGYSYSYARVPNGDKRVNMNGVLLGATYNANHWLGVESEFGTHYHCISGCWIYGIRVDNPDETNDSLSFLVGPRIKFARGHGPKPWIHALAGVTRTAYSNHLIDTKISTTGFGWAAGGGLDLPIGRVLLRAVQIDFTRYAAQPESFNNIRIGAGVVIPIGRQESRDR